MRWPTALLSVVLVLPVLITPNGLFDPLQGGLTESTELGNLIGPLNPLQVAGLWPSADFRFDPHLKPAVLALAVICLLIAAACVVACARQRDREGIPFAAYVGGGALGAAAIMIVGSPWVDGKAMASVSPALLAAALVGVVILGQRTRFRIEAGVIGAADRRGRHLVRIPRLPGSLVRTPGPLRRAREDRRSSSPARARP